MTSGAFEPGEWRLEGEGARFLGLPKSANPYPWNSIGGEIWCAGWEEADQIVDALMSDAGRALPQAERAETMSQTSSEVSDTSQG